MMFQFAAMEDTARMVDKKYRTSSEGIPEEGLRVLEEEKAKDAKVARHPIIGWCVTHDFDQDLRMFCWAECGPAALNKFVCERWRGFLNDPAWKKRGGAANIPSNERWEKD